MTWMTNSICAIREHAVSWSARTSVSDILHFSCCRTMRENWSHGLEIPFCDKALVEVKNVNATAYFVHLDRRHLLHVSI